MKLYNDLSFIGKLRRLRTLAAAVLAQYDLKSPEIAYYCFGTNLLYRVTEVSGERYILRLASPGWRTYEDLQSEALWLKALEHETDIPAPRVIPQRSGEYVLPMKMAGISRVWNATLMSWVPGRLLGGYLTQRNLEKMGELFAKLHLHGAEWKPPAGFTTRKFEHWLSRGEPNLIIDDSGAVAKELRLDAGGALSSEAVDLLESMHQQVEAAYAAIDRSDLRVIHCDLWHDNIRLHRGVLYPFDFEDTVWGFRAHDIAMAMLDLMEVMDERRYTTLLKVFRQGYETHLAWPDERIEPFQIGRLLWMINWVARHQPQKLVQMVERHVPVFQHYERTGEVIRPNM